MGTDTTSPAERSLSRESRAERRTGPAGGIEIGRQRFSVSRGLVGIARLEDEWYEDVADPWAVIAALQSERGGPDLFTFWQRLPHGAPEYGFPMEWDNVAALPVESYEHWWKHRVNSKVRALVRKSWKTGLEVRECAFTDAFVQGLVEIFNETPIRQSRPFLHYGKDFATLRREFSRYLFREQIIGAYLGEELAGFAMLADAGDYLVLSQIISKLEHRDKAPNNALIAKAVEICAAREIPYLVYAHWPSGPLADFKKQNGFEKVDLPRYYIPLSHKGRLALRLGVQHGWKALLPESLKGPAKAVRKLWYERHKPGPAQAPSRPS
jgi:hypothetical protein